MESNDSNERLNKILVDLKKIGKIEAVAISTRHGINLSAIMPKNHTPETLAAMMSTMLGAAETASIEFRKGIPRRVIVETECKLLIAMGAGSKVILAVVADSNIGLGLILTEMEKAVEKIKEILG